MRFVSAATAGRILTPVLCLSVASPGLARADDPAPAQKSLKLELNAMQPLDKGCRVTFLVENGLDSDLDKAAFEVALFNRKGQVTRLAVLNFEALPAGKTKVRQFDLTDTGCDDLGRVLVNTSTECKGAGVDPRACMAGLVTDTKTDAEFGL